MTIKSSFQHVLPYLPNPLQMPLSRISAAETAQIQEIRLRIGKQMHAVRNGKEYTVSGQGFLTDEPTSGITVTRQIMDTVFQNICSHSLHSCQHAIRQGYITIAGGSRVGLCGTAVMQETSFETVRAVSGLNIRIASERIGCAEPLISTLGSAVHCGGILIAGAPASGKTTILRDLARIIGQTRRICILDERGEIAAVRDGMPQFTLGEQTDVFDGYPKAHGISIAVRVMSPELLICDELGAEDEADALLQSLNTGVQIIASAHAGSLTELKERPQIQRLIRAGAFRTAVLLGTGSSCGQVLAAESLRGDI